MTDRRGWAVILVSVIALTLVWRILPAGSPPNYDGQCIANPYATLGETPAPAKATKTFPKAATFPPAEVYTSEVPPQAQILTEAGTFDNSTPVTVSIRRWRRPRQNRRTTIEGNVYRITAVNASGTQLEPLSPSNPVYIILRALSSFPAPTIDRFNGASWTPIATFNSGCGNTFEGTSTQMGEFAAVRPGSGGGTPAPSGGGIPIAAIIVGLALLLIIVVAVLFSLDRRRATRAD